MFPVPGVPSAAISKHGPTGAYAGNKGDSLSVGLATMVLLAFKLKLQEFCKDLRHSFVPFPVEGLISAKSSSSDGRKSALSFPKGGTVEALFRSTSVAEEFVSTLWLEMMLHLRHGCNCRTPAKANRPSWKPRIRS